MQISITIPDSVKDRVINALCGNYNYQAVLTDENGTETPNPETKAQFAKRMVISFIKENAKSYEATIDAETARQAALTKVDDEVTLS